MGRELQVWVGVCGVLGGGWAVNTSSPSTPESLDPESDSGMSICACVLLSLITHWEIGSALSGSH